MRVCLDTKVLVAAFATRGLGADVVRAVLAEHDLVLGQVILDELHRVLKQKLRLPVDRLAAVDAVLGAFEIIPRPAAPSPLTVRVPDDRWILATAVAGNADALVTGELDLLAVQADAPLPILEPRAFWELLRSARAGRK